MVNNYQLITKTSSIRKLTKCFHKIFKIQGSCLFCEQSVLIMIELNKYSSFQKYIQIELVSVRIKSNK